MGYVHNVFVTMVTLTFNGGTEISYGFIKKYLHSCFEDERNGE